jgi:hypothetical protein
MERAGTAASLNPALNAAVVSRWKTICSPAKEPAVLLTSDAHTVKGISARFAIP